MLGISRPTISAQIGLIATSISPNGTAPEKQLQPG